MACCTTQFGPPKSLAVDSLAAKNICAGSLNVCGELTASNVSTSAVTIVGPTGAVGSIGPDGIQGIPGIAGTVGFAEFIHLVQSPNNSVPPGTAFTIDTEVINGMSSNVVASAGAGGTVFTLTTGTYVLDYEMSLESAGSVAIYTGATAGTLAIDNNTIAGSTTATSWIHGRAGVVVSGASLVVAISSVVGTANVVTAGTAAGFFVIRLTIMKVA